ncbi:MAG: hypothetical protein IPM91_21770 [Bacteroidetes bacterium]|nr:hypothetical protein [Bacteroidota bacterium]
MINEATLRLNLIDNSPVSIQYLDITGKSLSEKITYTGRPGLQDFNITVPAHLETGIYRLLVSVGDQQALKSFYKK